jgi:hypothetical protein
MAQRLGHQAPCQRRGAFPHFFFFLFFFIHSFAAAMSSASPASPQLPDDAGAPAAAAASSGPSKSALKRARNKKSAAAKAAATQPAGAARGHGDAHSHGGGGGGGHSHSHGGGGGNSHSHGGGGHSHGGDGGSHSHSHGGGGGSGHSHSHGGLPCGGHGSDGLSLSGGSVSSEDLSEAVHYTDVLWHFQSYATHSFQRLERMHSDFTSIPTVLQSLVPGFEARMGELRKAVRANHEFLQEIVSHRYVFHSSDDIDYEALEEKVAREHPVDEERMSKVRSTLRQCVRDWSVEGAAERAACYGPILDELQRLFPDVAARPNVRVLVPGSGLGRLVWEVANLSFRSSGNEFSYQMLLCSFLILNCCKEKDIFTIFPFVHDSKNLYAPADQLRAITIPDVNPSQLPPGAQLSMMAGDWMDIFSDLPSEYIHGAYARKLEKERRRQAKFKQAAQKWEARRREEAKAAAAAAKAGLPAPAAAAPFPQEEEVEEPVADPVRSAGTTTGPMGEVEPKPSNASTWDVFASCYFVDCANNILVGLRTHSIVRGDCGRARTPFCLVAHARSLLLDCVFLLLLLFFFFVVVFSGIPPHDCVRAEARRLLDQLRPSAVPLQRRAARGVGGPELGGAAPRRACFRIPPPARAARPAERIHLRRSQHAPIAVFLRQLHLAKSGRGPDATTAGTARAARRAKERRVADATAQRQG